MDIFTKVKENVSMYSLISHFNFKTNRQNFMICPFHREDTPSLKIYDNSFCCFGCHKAGTVIDFTMYYLDMDVLQATKYLAKIFNICTDERLSIRERYTQDIAERNSGKVANKVFEQWLKNTWDTILTYYRILHQNSFNYDLENKLYVEAIHNLTKLDYYIDWLKEDPFEFYKLNRKWVEKIEKRLITING
ncbi:CHC2 zinc finger domain-containing protein [[Clostridium] colinum]|uniref:CHC2 zinc finger domain-containing protein n=1 Tax=[Clostridium] colinum TaxID=36835 RepID=UPI002024AD6D|nr:CHC2 zinc finger domain-containing protein [[Clostridium] colinum]